MNDSFDRAAEYLEAVRSAFGRLAADGRMSVVEYHYDAKHFGNAVLVLESTRLRIQIVRDRDQNLISVGPPGVREGHDLDSVLELLGQATALPDGRFMAEASLPELAGIVAQHRRAIEDLFLPERASESAARLEEIRRQRAKRLFG